MFGSFSKHLTFVTNAWVPTAQIHLDHGWFTWNPTDGHSGSSSSSLQQSGSTLHACLGECHLSRAATEHRPSQPARAHGFLLSLMAMARQPRKTATQTLTNSLLQSSRDPPPRRHPAASAASAAGSRFCFLLRFFLSVCIPPAVFSEPPLPCSPRLS